MDWLHRRMNVIFTGSAVPDSWIPNQCPDLLVVIIHGKTCVYPRRESGDRLVITDSKINRYYVETERP
jgi:hypothetical protein